MSDDLTLVRSIVDELFCRPESRYGGYRRKDQGHELLESTLFRFAMQTTERASVSLQIYRGLGDIGGSFWSTEARVLLRLAGWQHRALPNIRTGGYDIDADIGFVVTDRARYTLAEPGVMGDIAEQPSIALRHLLELSEALALIHRQGLLHRNLWPGTIEYLVNGDATDSSEDGGEVARDYQVRLSRFEMSEMVGNLLRFTDEQHAALATRARRLYLGQGREALACLPPQRLAALFSLSDRDQMEDETCDVFSLGVIAWQWFCGSLPNELVQRALPLGLNGGVDFDPAAHDELLLEMRRRLPARSPLLAELLRNMLEPGAAERMAMVGALFDYPELVLDPDVLDQLELLEGPAVPTIAALRRSLRTGPSGEKSLDVSVLLAHLPTSIHAFAAARLAVPEHEALDQAKRHLMENANKLRKLNLARETSEIARKQASLGGDWEGSRSMAEEALRHARRRHGILPD